MEEENELKRKALITQLNNAFVIGKNNSFIPKENVEPLKINNDALKQQVINYDKISNKSESNENNSNNTNFTDNSKNNNNLPNSTKIIEQDNIINLEFTITEKELKIWEVKFILLKIKINNLIK